MHSSPKLGPAGRWWDNKTVVQSIGINREQQKKMDVIFNANKSAIVESYKVFLREQSKLDAIGKDPKADKERIFATIDAVSQARGALQKATTEMLLAIRQQLNPDQIEKLEKLK
jgi:Spy/CpxP family protein refolding chaperone